MTTYAKDQLLHLDLPKEFQGNFDRGNSFPAKSLLPSIYSDLPWDLILLAMALFLLFQNNKGKTTHNN